MREEPTSTQNDQLELLELVGGPFCGAVLDIPVCMLEPGICINTPCIRENSPRQVWHLSAVYLVDEDRKGLFKEYVPSEF